MLTDRMQKFLFVEQNIRGVHVCMPQTVANIMQQHQYPQALHNPLGSCLVATVLLINRLKFAGELSLQLQANGSINLLVAKCNDHLHVRGLAQWDEQADEQALTEDFFEGRLAVTLAANNSTQPFQSIVELKGQTVSQALEHYFQQSEQLSTIIVVDINNTLGCGLLLQRMPDSSVDDAMWQQFESRLKMLPLDQLALSTEKLLTQHFSEYDIELYPPKTVQFKCHCSAERMQFAVKSMGRDEVEKILIDSPTISVACEYCNTKYEMGRADVDSLFSEQ